MFDRYTMGEVKAIARCYEEAYENGIWWTSRDGRDHHITNLLRIAEMRADFDRARKTVGKNYERITRFLNGEH